MDDLAHQIAQSAEGAVAMAAARGAALDYTPGSLELVEQMLAEAADVAPEMAPEDVTSLVQAFGCYVLEVGRRELGGRYAWFDQRRQPVLVSGEPDLRIALLAWDKVRGRLGGDPADNIPFFYAGFAQRVRQARPGDDALYV